MLRSWKHADCTGVVVTQDGGDFQGGGRSRDSPCIIRSSGPHSPARSSCCEIDGIVGRVPSLRSTMTLCSKMAFRTLRGNFLCWTARRNACFASLLSGSLHVISSFRVFGAQHSQFNPANGLCWPRLATMAMPVPTRAASSPGAIPRRRF